MSLTSAVSIRPFLAAPEIVTAPSAGKLPNTRLILTSWPSDQSSSGGNSPGVQSHSLPKLPLSDSASVVNVRSPTVITVPRGTRGMDSKKNSSPEKWLREYTLKTSISLPPYSIMLSSSEPALSNSYPNPGPFSATVIVAHQSLTAGQGPGNTTTVTVPFRGYASLVSGPSAWPRKSVKLTFTLICLPRSDAVSV